MPTSRLPLEIKSFLIQFIDSISHLEVLLMLFSTPEKKWDAQNVSKELRSNVTAATIQLENLHSKGLIAVDDSRQFSYHASHELNDSIKLLYILYHDKPVAIVSCIYEKPTDKLKGFSDAFKLKKD